MVAVTGGAGIGGIREIQTNTAIMITTVGEWDSNLGTPDETSTFAILDWGTLLSSGVDAINTPVMPTYTTYYPTYAALALVGNTAGDKYGHGGFIFRDFKVTAPSLQAILKMDSSSMSLNRIYSTDGFLVSVMNSTGSLNVADCHVHSTYPHYPLIDLVGFNGNASVTNNYFDGGGSVFTPSPSSTVISFYDNFVSGTTDAAVWLAGTISFQSVGNIMDGCGGCYRLSDSNGFSFGAIDLGFEVCRNSTGYNAAIYVSGHGSIGLYGVTGTGNGGGGITVADGGTALLSSNNVTVTGTPGDLIIDGNAYTYTAFWLLNPFNLMSPNSGSRIYSPSAL